MKRRDLLFLSDNSDNQGVLTNNLIDEKVKPRVLSGLETYTGKWDRTTAAHLLRRATFNSIPDEITKLSAKSMAQAVDSILVTDSTPLPPLDQDTGNTWYDKPYDQNNNFKYGKNLKAWWMSLIINSPSTIHEKMTLFWHNHFVSELASVNDARYMYKQNVLLRKNALGNIKTFVELITKDPAMLSYLNGNTNTNTRPNENYGRELQELFTIGKGPEIAPGNYTNYTEDDVKAAARVLTGWKDVKDSITTIFTPSQHDTADKKFSSAYNNYIVKGKTGATAGDDELRDMIGMIFSSIETAKYIARKLYRWFVYSDIDSATETNVIIPLAQILQNNNYEVKPALDSLFKSAHFYDSANIGAQLKTPIDFIANTVKLFKNQLPDPTKFTADFFTIYFNLCAFGGIIEMYLFDPPNVAGWPAYYQVPDFDKYWINTATLPQRNGFTDAVVYGNNSFGKNIFLIDSIATIQRLVSDQTSATTIIEDLSNILFPKGLTQQQKDYLLTQVFLVNLPEYEWGVEWNQYKSNPNNAGYKSAVKNKLDTLIRFMLRMAEFQLM